MSASLRTTSGCSLSRCFRNSKMRPNVYSNSPQCEHTIRYLCLSTRCLLRPFRCVKLVSQMWHKTCSSMGWPMTCRKVMNECAASQNGPSIDIIFCTRILRKAGSTSVLDVCTDVCRSLARFKAHKKSAIGSPANQKFLRPPNKRTSSSHCSPSRLSCFGDPVESMRRVCTRNRNGENWSQTRVMQDNCQSNCRHDICSRRGEVTFALEKEMEMACAVV